MTTPAKFLNNSLLSYFCPSILLCSFVAVKVNAASLTVTDNLVLRDVDDKAVEHGFLSKKQTIDLAQGEHALVIKYKDVLAGQTWSTFMNTSAIPESADFGGPLVAESFIRQGQIRYTNGGLQVSLENPHSDKGDNTQDSIPDFIAKYTFKGDWGNVSVSGVARQLNTIGGDTVSAAGFGVAGRIKTFGKDDFRFQVHGGETGRYVSVVTARDLVGEEAEQSTSIMAAYRHYWTEDMRSTVYYGTTDTDLGNVKNNHVAVNLFKNYTKQLSFGVEVGNFEMAEVNKNSNYLQFSAKYVL